MFDMELERQRLATFVDRHGWDDLLVLLNTLCKARLGYDRDLYSVSTEWKDGPRWCLKARGTRGDLLVKLI